MLGKKATAGHQLLTRKAKEAFRLGFGFISWFRFRFLVLVSVSYPGFGFTFWFRFLILFSRSGNDTDDSPISDLLVAEGTKPKKRKKEKENEKKKEKKAKQVKKRPRSNCGVRTGASKKMKSTPVTNGW